MSDPNGNGRKFHISLGNVINLVAIIAGAAVLYATSAAEVKAIKESFTEFKTDVKKELRSLRCAIDRRDGRECWRGEP